MINKPNFMKTLKRFSVVAVIILAFSASAFAQASATSNASATIVAPISIANNTEMNFGNVAVGATAGTVILATDGSRTTGGGVTLPTTTGTVTAAQFTVTGQANFTYSITLPAAATTISSGANNMTVDTWTSNPNSTGDLGAGGSQVLLIGATLNVLASQPSGAYTSATPFTVTVNYN